MTLERHAGLDAGLRDAVLALAVDARDADGVAPLSEQALLRIRGGRPGAWAHLLARDETQPGAVAAYAYVDAPADAPPAAELVVAPAARGRGHGGALLDAVLSDWPRARLWAHGHLPPARALAASRGLRIVRDLWRMGRPGSGEAGADLPASPEEVRLPAGFTWRTYTPADAGAWLAVNARAFATHGEQGRLTRADLAAREAQPWFDPRGFFLLEDARDIEDAHDGDGRGGGDPRLAAGAPAAGRPAGGGAGGRLAAFHWTKVADGVGEVYVVGVDPDYQGHGLGRAATELGLAHLRARGVPRIVLYVDGDNAAAIATYRRAGFTREAVDVQFAAPREDPDQ